MSEVVDRTEQRRILARCAERFLRGTAGYRQGQAQTLAQLMDMHLTREGYRLERLPRNIERHDFEGEGADCERVGCGEGRLFYLHEREVEL